MSEREQALAWMREKFPMPWACSVRATMHINEPTIRYRAEAILGNISIIARDRQSPQSAALACWAAWHEACAPALAASQAHAKALREALALLLQRVQEQPGPALTGAARLAQIALSEPADTSALDAERAKEFVRGALAAWDKRPWDALGYDARTWDIATESHAEYLDTMRRAAAALRGTVPAEGGGA